MIDYYNLFKTAAISKGYDFIYGTPEFAELKMQELDLKNTQGILMLNVVLPDFIFNGGLLNYTSYRCEIGLAMPSDNLDDAEEKYVLQLRDLEQQMIDFIKLIGGCSGGMNIVSANISTKINRFSENLDLVLCNLTFTDE